MKDNDFLKTLKKADIGIVEDFPESGYIDTGSYIFNALISGSIYKGLPDNRVTALAGAESTGKTYYALSCVKQFLIDHPTGTVVYFDTEFALEKDILDKRGIDGSRVILIQPETLQEFHTTALKVLDTYNTSENKIPMMFVLDSLGNLPTIKELTDATDGKYVRDMTKTQVIRSIFRTITQKLGKNHIPMIVTNHTYDVIGAYVPTKEMSGGGGLKYAASTIVTLAKSKDRDDDKNVIGSIIKLDTYKSRFSKEKQRVETRLSFETGVDRYYGLLDLAEKYKIFEKKPKGYLMPDGSTAYEKGIYAQPQKYFTKEILDRLDVAAQQEFSLGAQSANVDEAFDPETGELESIEE